MSRPPLLGYGVFHKTLGGRMQAVSGPWATADDAAAAAASFAARCRVYRYFVVPLYDWQAVARLGEPA